MLNSVDELIIIVLFVFILNRTLWNVNNWPIGRIYLYIFINHYVHSSIIVLYNIIIHNYDINVKSYLLKPLFKRT